MKKKPSSQNVHQKEKEIEFSDKAIFKVVLIVFVILLIPLLLISFYDVPSVDDFGFGANTRDAWLNTHSIINVLRESLKHTVNTYNGWQGSFAAIFLFTLQPAVFGEGWYFFTPLIMLLSIGLGIYALCKQVYGGLCGSNRIQYCTIFCVSYILCIEFIPSPSEGIYWYNGAIYYTFFFGLSLILYAGLLDCLKQSGTRLGVEVLSLSILSFIIAGGNLITGPITGVVYVLFFIFMVIDQTKRKRVLRIALPFILFCIGFMLNILAPGNANRVAADGADTTLFGSIIKAYIVAFHNIFQWTSLPVICIVIFMVPLLYKIAVSSSFSFRWPGLVILASYSMIATSLFPPLFAINFVANRGLNIVYFTYVLLLIFNVYYVVGWVVRNIPDNIKWRPTYTFSFTLLVPIILVFLMAFFRSNVTSTYALHSLVTSEAKMYHEEANERLTILNDETIKNAEIPAFDVQPYVLFFDDITGDPTNYRNISMQSFYKKDSVVCIY